MTLNRIHIFLLILSLPLAGVLYYGGTAIYYSIKTEVIKRKIIKILKEIKPNITKAEVETFLEEALKELHK